MNGIWKKCLGLTAGLLAVTGQATASDSDRVIARSSAPVIAASSNAASAPARAASIERPVFAETRTDPQPIAVNLERPRLGNQDVQPMAFRDMNQPIARAQSSELIPTPPSLSLPGSVPPPASGWTSTFDSPTLPGPMSVYDASIPVDESFGDVGISPDRFGAGDGVSHQFTNILFAETEYLLWTMRGQSVPALVTAGLRSDLLTPGSFGSQVLLGGQTADTNDHSGGRIRAGFWIDRDHSIGLEGSFFFLCQQSMNSSTASTGMPLLGIPFITSTGMPGVIPLAGEGFSGGAAAQLMNRLWGAEANIRHNLMASPCGHLDLILGFRAVGLDDNFTFDVMRTVGDSRTLTVSDSFVSRNRFYGGQIGLDAERQWGAWSLNLTGKLAVGDNNEQVKIAGMSGLASATVNTGLFAQDTNIGRHTRQQCIVVPEVSLKLGYQVSDCLRATLGYNFLYMSSVARASDQIDPMLSGANRPAFAFNGTNFWAQGVTAGLEFRY